MIKMIKMKLKNKYYVHSLLVLYVCYWPGFEDRSSGPGIFVSRSLSRGEFVSLSSIHVGFFFARERNHDDDDDSTKKYVKES